LRRNCGVVALLTRLTEAPAAQVGLCRYGVERVLLFCIGLSRQVLFDFSCSIGSTALITLAWVGLYQHGPIKKTRVCQPI